MSVARCPADSSRQAQTLSCSIVATTAGSGRKPFSWCIQTGPFTRTGSSPTPACRAGVTGLVAHYWGREGDRWVTLNRVLATNGRLHQADPGKGPGCSIVETGAGGTHKITDLFAPENEAPGIYIVGEGRQIL